MPLDFTGFKGMFGDNPDPERLKKILEKAMRMFVRDVAEYLDETGKIKKAASNALLIEVPIAHVLATIEAYKNALKSIGWPESQSAMLDNFIIELYGAVGLHKRETWGRTLSPSRHRHKSVRGFII
jgi:hypothetical protein